MNVMVPVCYIHTGFVTSFDLIVPIAYSFVGIFKVVFTTQFCLASLAIRELLLNCYLKYINS